MDVGNVNDSVLTRRTTTFQLHRCGCVVDVCRVQQSAECAGCACSHRTDEVQQTDTVGSAPRDEFILLEPIETGEFRITFSPVTVNGEYILRRLVQVNDVRTLTLTLYIIVDGGFIDNADTILVVTRRLLTFNLVIRLLTRRGIRVTVYRKVVHSDVETTIDTRFERIARQFLQMSEARGRVERVASVR